MKGMLPPSCAAAFSLSKHEERVSSGTLAQSVSAQVALAARVQDSRAQNTAQTGTIVPLRTGHRVLRPWQAHSKAERSVPERPSACLAAALPLSEPNIARRLRGMLPRPRMPVRKRAPPCFEAEPNPVSALDIAHLSRSKIAYLSRK
eukprot:2839122-Rhodomonas_salina.2